MQTPHRDVQLESIKWPSILVPEHKPYGVRTVDTLYTDEESWHDGHGHAYEGYGIDPAVGAVVIVRPDQYVSAVYGLEDFESIGEPPFLHTQCSPTSSMLTMKHPSCILQQIHAEAVDLEQASTPR